MQDFQLPKDHVVFSAASDIKQLCSPLEKYFGIETFSYVKINADMSRIHLDSNPIWNEFFYKNISKYLKEENLIEAHHWEPGFSTLYALNDPCIPDANQHNVGDGIVIANQVDGCTELCFFATKNDNNTQLTTLLNNLDLLHNFIPYFRESACDLISEANRNPIVLPYQNFDKTRKLFFDNSLNREEFFSSIKKNKGILSKRELDCITYLIQDMSAKQIAHKLHISKKTVERHFENARNKLGVKKTAALINFVNSDEYVRGKV